MQRRPITSEMRIINGILTESTNEIRSIYEQKRSKAGPGMPPEGYAGDPSVGHLGALYAAAETHGIHLGREGIANPDDPNRKALAALYPPGHAVHTAFRFFDNMRRARD